MKRFLIIVLFLLAGTALWAQGYPSEWNRYTTDAYYHDIESAATKQAALDQARSNLARQIQVRVIEMSKMDKQAVNGRSSVIYNSSRVTSTDVDMNLAETKSYFDATSGKHYVLVYIDKKAACTFYENDLKMLISNATNTLGIAGNYVASGFKSKAKAEYQNLLKSLEGVEKPFFWLNVFGLDNRLLQGYLTQVQDVEQTAKQMLADLEYGTTYCVVCNADLFGKRYSKLTNEVKGALASEGCNFVDDPSTADYVIHITASARQYNTFQGAYFTYVDAEVSIDKNATSQRIYEDETSVKGSHTLSYDEAARDGYKKITKEIVKLLKDNIKQ